MNEIGQERVASVEQKAYAKVSKDEDIEPYDFEDCKLIQFHTILEYFPHGFSNHNGGDSYLIIL